MNPAVIAKFAQSLVPGLTSLQFTDSITAGAVVSGIVGVVGTALATGGFAFPFIGAITAEEVLGATWLSHVAVNAFVPDSIKQSIVGLAQKAIAATKNVNPATPDVAKTTVTPTEAAAIAVIAAQTPAPAEPAAVVTMAKS